MMGTMGMRILAACGILMMLVGCATSSGRRFYANEPRPLKDVALILTKSKCHLDSITVEGQPKMNLWGEDRVLGELLPATYELVLRYHQQGEYSPSRRGGIVSYTLQVVAGHFYYIYAEFPTPNTWRPAVIDIARDEDYQKIANLNRHGWLGDSDEDSEFIRKRVNRYLAGPRTPLKKEDLSGITIEGPNGKENVKSLWR
jgi:hypothetical protein